MNINTITFPLYKLRSYLNIDKNPLGVVKVTTIKGTYILDDTGLNGTFEERRIKLLSHYPRQDIYKLKEKVVYLRQLVKYKSGTTFIDLNGNIIKYKKSSKLFEVKSYKITRKKVIKDNWTVIHVENLEQPFLIGQALKESTKYASIMETNWGPFLYDLSKERHEVFRRKI